MSFSVVVPTKGRKTLARTLASIAPQLEPGDEILVLRLDCVYGNEARDLMMAKATGTHLLFMDDDDVYTEGAFAAIRTAVAADPGLVHVFRMSHGEGITWGEPKFGAGNVGTPMVCIPNIPAKLARWEDDDGATSDWTFISETVKMVGGPPVFHEFVVAEVRPG